MQLTLIVVEMKGQYLSEERRIRVAVLHEEGYSSPKIARRVGCHQSTVIRIITVRNSKRLVQQPTDIEQADQRRQLRDKIGCF